MHEQASLAWERPLLAYAIVTERSFHSEHGMGATVSVIYPGVVLYLTSPTYWLPVRQTKTW